MTDLLNVGSLAGGISQQPPHMRKAGQTADAQNLFYSTAEGARKRHGTEFITEVQVVDPRGYSPNLSGTGYRIHAIERSATERHIMLFGASTLRVFNDDGTEVGTFTMTTNAEAYLDSNSADEDQLRLRSYADTTFLLNTTVPMAAAAGTEYELTHTVKNPTAVFSTTVPPSEYVKAIEDDDLALAGHYQYTMNDTVGLKYSRIDFDAITGDWASPEQNWKAKGLAFKIAVRRLEASGFAGAGYTTATRVVNKTGAFAGITWRLGDMVYVDNWSHASGTDGAWFLVDHDNGTNDDDNIVLEEQGEQVNTLSTGDGTLDCNTTDATYGETTAFRIGKEAEVHLPDWSTIPASNMYEVAKEIEDAMRESGLTNACCAWITEGGVNGHLQITGPYRSYEAHTYQPTTPATGTDLTQAGYPLESTGATYTQGFGLLSTSDDTASPVTRWSRVAAPNQPQATPDSTTMPMAVLRQTSNDFEVKEISWNDRTSGDENSNPIPDPWKNGAALSDITLHRNRIWFLSEDWVVASQDGDIYNFFLSDSDNQVDSDPISINYGSTESPVGEFLLPFRRALTLFTKGGQQYDLSAPESFTPTTVVVTPTTRLGTLASVSPASSGNLLYFMATLEDKVAMFEYFYDDIAVASATSNVSNHVPDLLPTTTKTVVSHQNSGMTFVLPAVGNSVLVYKAEFDGTKKRLSAWGNIVMDQLIQVIDIAVLGDRLFLFTTVAGYEFALESMPIGRETDSGSFQWVSHLDRRQELTGVYDGGNDRTDFDIGHAALGSTANSYVKHDGTYSIDASANGVDGAWLYGVAGVNIVSIPGDHSASSLVMGRFYTTSAELSRPYANDQLGQKQIGSRLTIVQMVITHIDTGLYSVASISSNRNTRTSTFNVGTTGVDAHGHSKHYLSADPDRTIITISDTSPKPLVWAGLQYEIDAAEMGALL